MLTGQPCSSWQRLVAGQLTASRDFFCPSALSFYKASLAWNPYFPFSNDALKSNAWKIDPHPHPSALMPVSCWLSRAAFRSKKRKVSVRSVWRYRCLLMSGFQQGKKKTFSVVLQFGNLFLIISDCLSVRFFFHPSDCRFITMLSICCISDKVTSFSLSLTCFYVASTCLSHNRSSRASPLFAPVSSHFTTDVSSFNMARRHENTIDGQDV